MKTIPDYFVVISSFILISAQAQVGAEPLGDSMHGRAHGEMREMMFKSMDTNGNGTVSKSEFNAYSALRFKKMDTNKDGKLTPDEMPGGDKPMLRHDDSTMHLDERFNAADTNKDGGIDQEEAKAMPMLSMYFDEVDENKDGKVTRQEYLDAMPKMHRGKRKDTGGNAQTL